MSYKATVLADSPASLWMCDESFGSGTAADSGSGGVTLTATSVTFGSTGLATNIPSSASFNGTSSNLSGGTFPGQANPAAAFGFEAWIKTSGTGVLPIVSGISTAAANPVFYVDSTHKLGLFDTHITTASPFFSATSVNDGNPHYVAVIWDGTHITFYIDGAQDVQRTPTVSAAGSTTGPYTIGSETGTSNFFLGNIAAVGHYVGTNQLTAAKIAAHYTAATVAAGPTITGADTVGQTLSCSDGGIGSPTYQWKRDAQGSGSYTNISSATSSTYLLVDADDACHIKCTVVSTDSNIVGPIVEPVPTNSVLPAVSMQAGAPIAVGNVASCTTGTWAHMGGTVATYAYQWYRGTSSIGSATNSTYTLVTADKAGSITCKVTATNTGGAGTAAQTVQAVTPTTLPYGWLRAAQPLLTGSVTWEQNAMQEPNVLVEASQYSMWYSGGWAAEAIGYASCPIVSDPTVTANWTKYASNPVLGGGGSGLASVTGRSNVLKVGSIYYCYFCKPVINSDLFVRTSTDGLTWGSEATAIAHNQVGWTVGWANSFVWNEGGTTWKMLVEGETASTTPPWAINYATSTDGLSWTVQGSGPLTSLQPSAGLTYSGPWLARSGAKIGGNYQLWYHSGSGVNTDLYYAYSTDAQTWTLGGAQILHNGSTYENQQISDPSVVEHGGTVYLFADGVNNGADNSWINANLFAGSLEQMLGISTPGAGIPQDDATLLAAHLSQ